MSSAGGGWLTTKKRGRDDGRIAEDRAAALRRRQEERRRRLPAKKGASGRASDRAAPTRQSRQSAGGGKRLSEDAFIVNDDDESEEDSDLGGSDESSLLSVSSGISDSPRNKRPTGKPQPKPQTKMHPHPRHRRSGIGNGATRKTAIELLEDDSSHDEITDLAPIPPRRREAEDIRGDGRPKGIPVTVAAASRADARVASSLLDEDSTSGEDSLLMTPARKNSRFFQQKKAQAPAPPDSCSPLPARRRCHPLGRPQDAAKRRVLHESSDEDNDNNSCHPDGDAESAQDPDEALALKLALRESLRDLQQAQPKRSLSSSSHTAVVSSTSTLSSGRGGTAEGPDAVDSTLLDTDSEPEAPEELLQEDDEGDDAYCGGDDDARAAVSVLEAANRLSAKVLVTMTKWAGGNGSESASEPAGVVPVGMIVDGALALSGLNQQAVDVSRDSKWISRDVLQQVCPAVTLADYQLVGVNWLALMHGLTCEVPDNSGRARRSNVNGVLADEMGLGKTVQTIVFLRYLKHINYQSRPGHRPLPHLVVVPSSVLSNWQREFKTFAPDLQVVLYHGSLSVREQLQNQLSAILPNSRNVGCPHGKASNRPTPELDVILTPVTYFQTERKADRHFLLRFQYDYMVVDEAHMLKNARCTRYKSLDKFHTQHRLLLTGTPVQNSPKELLSLLCFLMPLFANRPSASDEYDESSKSNDGGEGMLQHFVSLEGQKGSSDEAAYRKLKQLFAPFVLRRKKSDVLQQILPPKHQRVEFVELTNDARTIYDSILADHFRRKELGQPSSAGDHLFTQLRKAAHHPLLLRTRYLSGDEKDHLARCFYQYGAFRGEGCTRKKVDEQLQEFSDFDIHVMALELLGENPIGREDDLRRYILDEEDLFCSSKFQCLRKLLPQLTNAGHRILIFSIWTNCLDLLSCLMESLGFRYLRMEGSTPVSERQALIDEFNKDDSIPVFLLSTKACGLGINLTAADTCIIHDLDFNPFNDLQAEDRCHRIGQKLAQKPVTVYKLVSKATVDEDVYRMQERKAKMNAAIMDSANSSSTNWEQERRLVLQTAVDRYLRTPQELQDVSQGISIKDAGKENSFALEGSDDVAL